MHDEYGFHYVNNAGDRGCMEDEEAMEGMGVVRRRIKRRTPRRRGGLLGGGGGGEGLLGK